VCYLLRLVRSIGKLKVSMHGPMNFATSVFSDEGKATQEQLSTKRAAKPKAIGAAPGTADKGKTLKEGDASVPAPHRYRSRRPPLPPLPPLPSQLHQWLRNQACRRGVLRKMCRSRVAADLCRADIICGGSMARIWPGDFWYIEVVGCWTLESYTTVPRVAFDPARR